MIYAIDLSCIMVPPVKFGMVLIIGGVAYDPIKMGHWLEWVQTAHKGGGGGHSWQSPGW